MNISCHHHYHHYHHYPIQRIPIIKNYEQGLRRKERRQLIPMKESAANELLRLEKDI